MGNHQSASNLANAFGRQRPESAGGGLSLQELVNCGLVLEEDVENLTTQRRAALAACSGSEEILNLLVDYGLLTSYQASRLEAGTGFGLILGNYRVLDRLGAGGMGVVFRAQHILMRRHVAIKVLPYGPENDPRLLSRFLTEIRAIAELHHPNIVAAIDAGKLEPRDDHSSVLHFFVMEYVPGVDLDEYVRSQGPIPPAKACDIINQVASALAEAFKHNLVHRDIKPSNIQVTPEGQAKLLDFGLARKHSRGITQQGALLGTLDYMAPEQVQDAHSVDIRADLYGLGGVLYWCLTGSLPFASQGNIVKDLAARLQAQPPSLLDKQPDMPIELDMVVQKMMALHPDDRFAEPREVMQALLPFLKSENASQIMASGSSTSIAEGGPPQSPEMPLAPRAMHVLIVDDEPGIRLFSRYVLQAEGMTCDEAESGAQALQALNNSDYDLILLDLHLEDMSGMDVCRKVREGPGRQHLKILLASGAANVDAMGQTLQGGVDDFITKPFSVVQLQSRVKFLLKLKEAQDRGEALLQQLAAVNRKLEHSQQARDNSLVEAREALVLALANLAARRANDNGNRLQRLQEYVRCLAREARRHASFASEIGDTFIELVACCAPLHDIGKVGLPDHILLKPGKLVSEERVIMQTHTLIGADTLHEVSQRHASATGFLRTAIEIARHHHERYDGKGYPDQLAGDAIPLAARLVAICDAYDALRSRRIYKPALSHQSALQVMNESAGTQFDPNLMAVFQKCAGEFEKIFRSCPD